MESAMIGNRQHPCYYAYLLRLWETADGAEWVWRASLESPATGERHGFGSLPELFAYLVHETQEEQDAPADPPK
jgi:hypothetical protein